MKLATIALLPLLVLATACTGAAPPVPLDGSRWRLVSGLEGLEGVEVTLEFGEDGRVSGSGGCNRYNGQLRPEGEAQRFGPIAATKRGCFGAPGEVEPRYFAALGQVTAIAREGDRLRLTGPDGLALEFTPLP